VVRKKASWIIWGMLSTFITRWSCLVTDHVTCTWNVTNCTSSQILVWWQQWSRVLSCSIFWCSHLRILLCFGELPSRTQYLNMETSMFFSSECVELKGVLQHFFRKKYHVDGKFRTKTYGCYIPILLPWDFISVYSRDLSLDPHTSTMGVSLSHYSKALLLLGSSWHNGWLWWWTENPLTALLCVCKTKTFESPVVVVLCRSRESARGSGHYSRPHCFLLFTIVPWNSTDFWSPSFSGGGSMGCCCCCADKESFKWAHEQEQPWTDLCSVQAWV
jgi:hypothetical protein